MKVMVIGLGSMGRRRIRLIKEYNPRIEIVGADVKEDRRVFAENEYGIVTCLDLDEAFDKNPDIDVAFVSSSPLSHASIIEKCLTKGTHVFTEINLVNDGYDENLRLASEKGLSLFLSSTLMYRREIEFIKRRVWECSCPASYIYHVGQYLPDWHPWEDYTRFFVGDKRTNACRELMAIEFPWIFDIFGFPIEWHIKKSQNSSLKIDYPDTFQIQFVHPKGIIGMIQIDIVSRKAVRRFEYVSEKTHLMWDGTPKGLINYDYNKKEDFYVDLYETVDRRGDYSESIIEDAYLAEISEFMSTIRGEKPRYSFAKDKEILSLIDDIELN